MIVKQFVKAEWGVYEELDGKWQIINYDGYAPIHIQNSHLVLPCVDSRIMF
jgi:hypothetical protein